MNDIKKPWTVVLLGCLFLSSCIMDDVPMQDDGGDDDLSRIAVLIDSRAESQDEQPQQEPSSKQIILNRVNTLLNDGFVDGKSIFYISQNSNSVEPNFTDGSGSADDGSSTDGGKRKSKLYRYLYYDNPDAWWGPEGDGDNENIGGYNFAAVQGEALNWQDIIDNGQIDSRFTFCGLYFPADNNIRFEVAADQSDLEQHRQSNILGALHSTAYTKNRLRFRLYHLMVYLDVELYVPVYDPEDNSGYMEDAVKKAVALNFYNRFNMSWYTSAGADLSPEATADNTSATDIVMYMHPESELTSIDVSDFYPSEDKQIEEVRKYTFGVLFPTGQDVLNNNSINQNLLRFTLQTPGGTEKSYTFSPAQINGHALLQFSKGSISSLALYLPRHENNTIVVNAEIIDWNHAYSDMQVMEEQQDVE